MAPPRKSDVLDGEVSERSSFRRRIGVRDGEEPMERVPRLQNAILGRITRIGLRSSPALGRSTGVYLVRDVPAPRAFSRRCVVKARFVPITHTARGWRRCTWPTSSAKTSSVAARPGGSAGRRRSSTSASPVATPRIGEASVPLYRVPGGT
jgi:hypothetical protein